MSVRLYAAKASRLRSLLAGLVVAAAVVLTGTGVTADAVADEHGDTTWVQVGGGMLLNADVRLDLTQIVDSRG